MRAGTRVRKLLRSNTSTPTRAGAEASLPPPEIPGTIRAFCHPVFATGRTLFGGDTHARNATRLPAARGVAIAHVTAAEERQVIRHLIHPTTRAAASLILAR